MRPDLSKRLEALELAQQAAIEPPGPDASDLEELTYRIRRTARESRRVMSAAHARRLARRCLEAQQAMDTIEHGDCDPWQ